MKIIWKIAIVILFFLLIVIMYRLCEINFVIDKIAEEMSETITINQIDELIAKKLNTKT